LLSSVTLLYEAVVKSRDLAPMGLDLKVLKLSEITG